MPPRQWVFLPTSNLRRFRRCGLGPPNKLRSGLLDPNPVDAACGLGSKPTVPIGRAVAMVSNASLVMAMRIIVQPARSRFRGLDARGGSRERGSAKAAMGGTTHGQYRPLRCRISFALGYGA